LRSTSNYELKVVSHGMVMKTSKEIERTLVAKMVEAKNERERAEAIFGAGYAAFRNVTRRQRARDRRSVLIELANLHDKGLLRFFRKWIPVYAATVPVRADLFAMREQLRRIWMGERDPDSYEVLQGWLRDGARNVDGESIVEMLIPNFSEGRLEPAYNNFRIQLSEAVLEHSGQMATCRNPECVAQYFLAKRRTQLYCELGECTRYAQRLYALDWWNRTGKLRDTKKGRSNKAHKPQGRKIKDKKSLVK
jgi:hypothetical protein